MEAMIIVFLVGYLAIALEHVLKVNKAAIALMMAVVVWTIYAFIAPGEIESQISGQLGEVSSIIVFLLGAMTIVELVDLHGGFALVSHFIKARRKKYLLWLISAITFIMSAALDNMTSTIIMIAIMSKLVENRTDKMWFASAIVIAANSGGVWSPIGDVTTIMLWVNGNVTSGSLIPHLFLPSVVSLAIPVALITFKINGNELTLPMADDLEVGERLYPNITRVDKVLIVVLGVGGLVMVPVFRAVTGLPPFMGVVMALAALWLFTEFIYGKRTDIEESQKLRIAKALKKIDAPTIFFFFGILMAVGALTEAGLLAKAASFLDVKIHNTFIITGLIGILSAVVDNVPLVAAAMGMYPLADPALVEIGSYAANFLKDGAFWELLAYCAGTGGSLLIIGSVSGVVAMGAENISFGWYAKHITFRVFIGYVCGIALYIFLFS
ncbi:MAG: sodium:proton antiporter NhaD [Bacteroidales bacterium]